MGSICYNCFCEKSLYGPCSFCGYDPTGAEKKYPLALKPGTILNGRYIVGRALGQGGFGITYIAQDYQTGERVAIKENFPSELARRSDSTLSSVQVHSENQQGNFDYGKAQFLEEAKTLAAFMGDEHIVRIYSYFEENNTAYFVMEYVDGFALDKYMARQGGRLSPDEANRLLLPLMLSLGAVHARGIIHRDIAPDNILIAKDGAAKLIDFGAARYSTGEKSKSLDVVLKHGFAPKEQYLRRGRQGPFTDIYALAATYYYAITGKVPPESIERMDEDNLIPPSALGVRLSEKAEDALFKALEVNAQDRFQSMEEFYRAMAGAMPAGSGARPSRVNTRPTGSQQISFTGTSGFSVPQTGLSPREEAALLEKRAKEILAEEERKEREEKERLARIEAARLEQERREREAREQAERLERERKAKEAREAEERKKREAKEAEERRRQEAREEAERLKKERAEQKAREEAARQEKLRLEREKREEEKRLAAEKKKKEAEEKERLRQEALAKQKAEQEQKRAEAERLKKEREEQKARQAQEKALQKQKAKEKQAADAGAPKVASADNTKPKKKAPLFAAMAAILVAAVAIGFYLSPGQAAKRSYNKGIELMESGQYSDAAEQFEALGDYEDAEQQLLAARYAEGLALKNADDLEGAKTVLEQIGNYSDAPMLVEEIQKEIRYQSAEELLAQGQYRNAYSAFLDLGNTDFKDSAAKAEAIQNDPAYYAEIWADPQVGDTLFFGSYEQDNNLENGKEDIEWLVLDRQDDRILVISKHALDVQKYHKETKKVTWETCSLRSWLNKDFLSAAFTADEQKCIPLVAVSADKNPAYDTDQGSATNDKVFLLSVTEAMTYFASENERQCRPTAYAEAEGSQSYSIADGSCKWWLRTLGYYSPAKKIDRGTFHQLQMYAGIMNHYGKIIDTGIRVTDFFAIRPAMWIDLKAVQAAAYYEQGVAFKEAGEWDNALSSFEQAGDYLDAQNQMDEIWLQLEMQNLSAAQVGDYVVFGSYEQDNDLENGKEPIEWLVLDVKDGRSMLISKYALDAKRFNPENKIYAAGYKRIHYYWGNCTLRSWLNNDFFHSAFSDSEQKQISTTVVDNSESDGNNTDDKLFLLSKKEVEEYFSDSSSRICKPTAYAIANGAFTVEGNCFWWLRSTHSCYASCIDSDGRGRSDDIISTSKAVRPVIWVDYTS